jgi:hypothetical protein
LVISYGVLKSGQPFDVNDDGVWGETPRATLLPKSQNPTSMDCIVLLPMLAYKATS